MFNNISKMKLRDKKSTVTRELSHVSLDAFQMKHIYVQNVNGLRKQLNDSYVSTIFILWQIYLPWFFSI